jgi:hypothetical protein
MLVHCLLSEEGGQCLVSPLWGAATTLRTAFVEMEQIIDTGWPSLPHTWQTMPDGAPPWPRPPHLACHMAVLLNWCSQRVEHPIAPRALGHTTSGGCSCCVSMLQCSQCSQRVEHPIFYATEKLVWTFYLAYNIYSPLLLLLRIDFTLS